MKKLNKLSLFVRERIPIDNITEAKEKYTDSFESYSESTGLATIKRFYSPENIDGFRNANLSLGFGLIDSIGHIESYRPKYSILHHDDYYNRKSTYERCVTGITDPRYRYYWEIPNIENDLTNEIEMAFTDICDMLNLDSDILRKGNLYLSDIQLLFKLKYEYHVRVVLRK